jgi:hypothetical protein
MLSTTLIPSASTPAFEPVRSDTGRDNLGAVIPSGATPAFEPVRKDTGHRSEIMTADWDAPSTWKCAYPDGTASQFTKTEFLRNEHIRPGITTLIVEAAHLKERNEFSVSQVFTVDELNAWTPGIDVLLFPEKIAHKVLREGQQTKDRDSESLLSYINAHPNTVRCLRKFTPPQLQDNSSWEWRNELRDDICKMLNILRAQWKDVKDKDLDAIPQVAHCRKLVTSFIDELTPEQRAQFRVKVGKVGERKGEVCFESPTQLFTLYSCVYNMRGELRLNPSGEFIGVDTVMNKIIGLNHAYMPNLIRANLMHFGLRPKTKKAGIENHTQTKAEFTRNVRKMIQLLRDAEKGN